MVLSRLGLSPLPFFTVSLSFSLHNDPSMHFWEGGVEDDITSHSVAQAGLELTEILLLQLPKRWDDKHEPPCLAQKFLLKV